MSPIFTTQTPWVKKEDVKREWYIIDAKDKILGRLASKLAYILQGKHRPDYTPHVDQADFIVVVNAEKIKLTGKKLDQKVYWRHSGYMGGLKLETARKLLEKKPEQLIYLAVKRMLPRNRMRKKLLKKLKIYAGSNHPHLAQNPKPLEI
ncbi:MAG: 50S ribosomal protein L13 [Thermodesulfobacterium geofontis]|uniref:Large ribosomal subunit protein uL13 n=1 Tax=Thermodesulfobacterium geofontis TaxID=1295609 RepID=A0A2N7PN43_9BACT|nr:MAG: 50S ribosomal protein L13 [Thermodesulfobacterium geofontis]PMP93545.1 MAG: 50S ribosomal protein L13 [Thermodesulfobacterium geofontis]